MVKNTRFNFLKSRVEQTRKRALFNDVSSENRSKHKIKKKEKSENTKTN